LFTGIVDAVGEITKVERTAAGVELTVECDYTDLAEGESIALNGVCLTVRKCGPRWFNVGAVVTTTGRTTIGSWETGRRVNLERAMQASSRFGGHIVQGHVDGAARVAAVTRSADAFLIDIDLPAGLANTLVLHGSVTVDGVSLTVNDLKGDKLQVSIIDYTFRHTTLGQVEPGDEVQIETDVIGKYVQRLVAPYLNQSPAGQGHNG
jgi:riboflavin synthase